MLTAGGYIGDRKSQRTLRSVVRAALVTGTGVLGAFVALPVSTSAAVEAGALTQLGEPASCIGETKEEVAKCGTHVPFGLSFAYEVQVSPDGRNAYSVAVNGDLIEYARNQANGSLSVIGCFSSQPSSEPACANAEMEVAAIESPAALAVSPDGSSVYVIGQGTVNDLVEFSRDPETGLLTEIGCITNDPSLTGCTTVEAKGLELPYGVTVSPDGENVYVASFADEAIAEFKRNTVNGVLTQLAGGNNCISDKPASGCETTTAIGLKEAIGVVVSPDGKDLYAGAGGTSAEGDIAAFERGAEGALKQLSPEEGCIGNVSGCTHGASAEHIEGTEDIAISPDGNNVYATSTATNSVIEMKRSGTGALEQLVSPNQCVTTENSFSGCTEVKEIGGPVGLAVSSDGANVYVSSRGENSVAAFARGTEGELTQLASYPCVTEAASGCEPVASNERTGFAWPRRVTVSPDGTNVYVAAQSGHSIAELARAVTPTVTNLSNGGGPYEGGNEITIEGTGFIEGATVEFAGVGGASNVQVDSASAITAVAPPGHGTAHVVVTTSSGSSSIASGEYVYGRLGGLFLVGYCEGLGYHGNGKGAVGLLRNGEVEGPNFAYENWACIEGNGTEGSGATVPIAAEGPAPSMDNACAVAFPSVLAHAHADDPNNAFSWNCYEGAPPAKQPGGEFKPPVIHPASELVQPIAVVPPPVLAKTGNVAPVEGTVSVQLPGQKAFVLLSTLTQIPFGSIIEATHGKVSVTATEPNGKTETGVYFGGRFKLTQERNGTVVATLTGGNFSVCPTARERAHKASAGAYIAASGKHSVRKLWTNAHGKFSTRGNYAAGAVQGTEWLTDDLCEGTLIKVTRDKVAVTNLVNRKRVLVKVGHHYLAKAP